MQVLFTHIIPKSSMQFLTNLISRYYEFDTEEFRKRQIFVICLSIITIPLSVIGVYHFFLNNYLYAVIDISMAVICVMAIFILRRLPSSKGLFRISTVGFFVLLMYWMIDGAMQGTASLWILCFPLIIFFMLGKKEGLFWAIALLLCCLAVFVLPKEVLNFYTYSIEYKIRFILSLSMIILITYQYESIRDIESNKLQSEKTKLAIEIKNSEKIKSALEAAIENFKLEVRYRIKTEANLQIARNNLEVRIKERTFELEKINQELKKEISDRKKIEDELQKSEEKFRKMADLLPQTIFELDEKSHLTYSNLRGFELTGYLPEDMNKKNALELLFPEDIERLKKDIYLLLNNQRPVKEEYALVTKSGKEVPVLIYAQPIFRNSVIRGVRGIVVDIEHRKKEEKALLIAKETAEKANESKNNFMAIMSHELRTPMNGVMGMAELLSLTSLDDQQKKYVDAVNYSGNAFLKILDNILDLTRIEANKYDIENEVFDLRTTVENVINLFSGSAIINKIELILKIDDSIPKMLFGDSNRLAQVLSNIIANAQKFTEEGQIELNISKIYQTHNSVKLRFEISDTGIGISEEDLENIFDAFSQVDSSTTRQHGGTGLGLAIVKEIIELMDGELGVESNLGKGSLFWFELALQKLDHSIGTNKDTQNTRESKPKTSSLARAKLLLVEDDLINQLVISEMLKNLGQTIEISSSGIEALENLKSNEYDLIFMDCLMPGMDGLETTRQIRLYEDKTEKKDRVPIIALTAKAMTGEKEKCLQSGMDDYLKKPVTIQELRDTLKYYLS